MTKTNSKKALLSSAFALVLSIAMLIGTTFAWFTDTASTGVNKIQAGTLKIDIVDAETKASIKNSELKFVSADNVTKGEDILWEPNATYKTTGFKIKNDGNLALKYKMMLNGIKGDSMLLDVIKFSVVNEEGAAVDIDSFEGYLTNETDTSAYSETLYIQGHMDANAGNDYQGKTLEGLGITVLAAQYTYESDSFDNQYDKNATYLTYPTGVTTKNFEEATSVAYTDTLGNVKTGNKPAVAAYVDSNGATQYAADVKAAVMKGANVIYCKKDADMKVNATGTNRTEAITADLTIYANGADFGYGEIALNNSTSGPNTLTGNVNVKVYDAKNIKVWGSTPAAGVTWNIELVNCTNIGEDRIGNKGILFYITGNTEGTVNATVKNCYVTANSSAIYMSANGSLNVIDSTFVDCATGIKSSYKCNGTRNDRIENCVFTKCGCTTEMAGTTTWLSDDSAAYKYKSSGTGTITLTTKGNKITGTIGDKGDTQIAENVNLIEE